MDGENAIINYGGGDLKNLPVEVLESKFPLRMARHLLNVDSGGAGRQRGGLGIIKDYLTLSENITLSLWFERSLMPAWGLFGGASGKPPVVVLNPGTRDECLTWKVNHLPTRPGMCISARTGGGGGYGPPWERPIEMVLDDVTDGYVSRASAERDHGLRFTGEDLNVDHHETLAAREAMA
jgi:N-methylhydantoinase B